MSAATISRAEGVAAVLSHWFTLLVLTLIVTAPLVVAWLDRHARRTRREADRDAIAEALGILRPTNPFALTPDTQRRRAELHADAAKVRAMRGRR